MKKINFYGLILTIGCLTYMSSCKKLGIDPIGGPGKPVVTTPSGSPLDPKSPIYDLPFPATMAYVEVNNGSLNNMGCYKMNDGKTVVNIANIFAGNINLSQEKTPQAVVSLNAQVDYLLEKTTYVKDLKAKGIKVTLSLLNNHDGSGWSQFTKQADADYFAKSVKATVDKFGLDGVEIDDEYAGAPGNEESIPMVVAAIRKLMPNTIIGYYIYSDSGVDASAILGKISDLITYAVTDYPQSPSQYTKYFKKTGKPGDPNDHSDRNRIFVGDHAQWGTLSKNLDIVTDKENGGYGGIMLFDANNYTVSEYEKVAKGFYGDKMTVADPKQASNGGCLSPGGEKMPDAPDHVYVLPDGSLVKSK
ncbi:glycosyl hydrolase family 18 protein [Pedobacter lusitanus]|uniref:glycosyl hydrolase family 18 protein n=1 Tax=Pedobacter lusitanus TaxID=1503925 RepID=UPI0006975654|nr:glycosyl hydrolase family 18 protein [Pedobacter lusitanus]